MGRSHSMKLGDVILGRCNGRQTKQGAGAGNCSIDIDIPAWDVDLDKWRIEKCDGDSDGVTLPYLTLPC
jgi:hypothetical protein